MKAVYFPFTLISDEVMTAITNCFDSIVVYQPSSSAPKALKQWASEGRIEIRCPVSGNEDHLERIVREYQRWAELHDGAELSAFRFMVDDEESSIARIRTTLNSYGMPQTSGKSDPMFNVRLFLRIAQEYDLQHQEVDKEISAFEKMEKALMEELRGEDDLGIPLDKIIVREDVGEYMTSERMIAWTQLMLRDTEESCLFLTSSRAILEYFQDKAVSEPTEEVGDFKIPETCLKQASFYKIAENPRRLFARCADIAWSEKSSGFAYTIIGMIRS